MEEMEEIERENKTRTKTKENEQKKKRIMKPPQPNLYSATKILLKYSLLRVVTCS